MTASSLLAHLADQMIAPVIGRGWFGGDYVRLGDYMRRAQRLYETGAVLGHAFRDKLGVLAEVFGEPGRETDTLKALAESATSQAARTAGEPPDFYALFFKPEAARVMGLLCDAGRARYSAWPDFPRVIRKKLRRADFFPGLTAAGWKGIAFGSQFPERTEKLLGSVPDGETWRLSQTGDAYAPPAPPKPKPLAERQAEAVSMIRPYIEQFRPDLLARLGLWPDSDADYYLRLRALQARDPNENT